MNTQRIVAHRSRVGAPIRDVVASLLLTVAAGTAGCLPHLPSPADLHGDGCKVWFSNEKAPHLGYYAAVSDRRSTLHGEQDSEGPSMQGGETIFFAGKGIGTFTNGVLTIGDFTTTIAVDEPKDGSFTIESAKGGRKFLIQYNAACVGEREIALGTAGVVLMLDADLNHATPRPR